jgi:hypothetical protein
MKTLLIAALAVSFLSPTQASENAPVTTKVFDLSKSEITAILDLKTKTNISFSAIEITPISFPVDITLIAQQKDRKLIRNRSTKVNTTVGDE